VLVLEDGFGGVAVVEPRWSDRLAARALCNRLDNALAGGVSPDSSARMSLRARRLTGMGTRRALAQAARMLAERARSPRSLATPGPCGREVVVGASDELEALSKRLEHSGPVSACGVARASELLAAVWGPAYRIGSSDQLRAELMAAMAALDPVTQI
jgi:sarcosine oxidase gamma subunit